MTVEEKIKKVADQMTGEVTYLFDNWQTANVKLDNIPMPAMLNVLPVSGSFSVGKHMLKDCPNCLFAFMDLAEFDFDGKENDMVIERCKKMAKEFILLLNQSGLFEPVDGDIPYSVFYDKLDVNVTGITIELRLIEMKGITLCDRPPKELIYGKG